MNHNDLGLDLRPILCDEHDYYWWSYNEDEFEPPCPDCAITSLMNAHAGCEHSHHRWYRSSKAYRKLADWLYALGIVSSTSWRMGGGCTGCVTINWDWHQRPYVLGLSRGAWRCLIRGRHLPGEPIAFGMCGECLPCPSCGDTSGECPATCEWAA